MDNKGFEGDSDAPPDETKHDSTTDSIDVAVDLTESSDSGNLVVQEDEDKHMDNEGFKSEACPLPKENITHVETTNDGTYETLELTEIKKLSIIESDGDSEADLTDIKREFSELNVSESEGNNSNADNETTTSLDNGPHNSEPDSDVVNVASKASSNGQNNEENVLSVERISVERKFKEQHCSANVPNDTAYNVRQKDTKQVQSEPIMIKSKSRELQQNGAAPNKQEFIKVLMERKDDCIILKPLDLIKQGNDETEGENLLNGSPKIVVERTIFTQKTFDEAFEPGARPSPTIKQRAQRKMTKYSCSGSCFKDFLFTLFPFIAILKNYKIKQDLPGDVIAGLTVGIMHIPQGMAYGMLTTLPPVYGLYMSFFPVLVYFFFGSSKHISIGTFAVACLMIGTTVQKGFDKWGGGPASILVADNSTSLNATTLLNTSALMNGTGGVPTTAGNVEEAMPPEELSVRLGYAMSLTFMVGIIQLVMGITRLGFVTVYLSDPLISGFTTGAACHVFTSQIKHVFGVSTPRYSGAFKLIYTYRDFFTNIPTTNPVTLIMAVICMAILYCTSRFINQNPKLKPKMFMPVPIELIVVVLGTVLSYFLKLETQFDVKIVNDIPTGLPLPSPPFQHLGEVIADAFALAIVIFAVSISMAKILAKKNDYEVNANQELVAFGISNIVSSFFASASPSASLSRSLIQERGGGKTQVAGLVSCVLLLVVLLAIGPYFRTLPNCVLAAIIIVALRGMFLQVLDLKKLWSMSLIDFFVWVVAFLATVLLDVDLGLLVAVLFGIITIVARSQRPYVCLLGRIPDTDIYRDINIYQEAKEVEGVKIYRFEYSLFFVNIEHFRMNLYKMTLNPRTLKIAQKKREKKLAKRLSQAKIKTDATGSMEMEVSDPNKNQPENEVKVNVIAKPIECPPDCDFHTIILDCSSWGFVDSMGVKVLSSVIAEYKTVGVRVFLANCKAGIREMFEKTGFYKTVDRHNVYITVHDAVLHSTYVEETTIEIVRSTEAEVDASTPLTTDIDYTENTEDDPNLRHADSEGLLAENNSS